MIGFLIINYNDALTTKKLLNNIKEYSCLQYIVVVDNGSTDHSFEELKTYQSDKIHIIRREGRNFGAGINYGVNYLANLGISYTFISNSDVEIKTEQDLQQIISYREKGTILAPVIREHSGLNRGWKVPTNTQLVLQSIPVFYRLFAHFNHYPNSYYSKDLIPVEVVSLFQYVFDERQFSKNSWLHIGDNLVSDVNSPKSFGIDAFYYPNVLSRSKYENISGDITESIIKGILQNIIIAQIGLFVLYYGFWKKFRF